MFNPQALLNYSALYSTMCRSFLGIRLRGFPPTIKTFSNFGNVNKISNVDVFNTMSTPIKVNRFNLGMESTNE